MKTKHDIGPPRSKAVPILVAALCFNLLVSIALGNAYATKTQTFHGTPSIANTDSPPSSTLPSGRDTVFEPSKQEAEPALQTVALPRHPLSDLRLFSFRNRGTDFTRMPDKPPRS